MPKKKLTQKRNGNLFDIWSITHMVTGIILGWTMTPFVALTIMILYEPLETLVLNPLFFRIGITFGKETIRNSLSDIVFDTAGVVLGAFVLGAWMAPPFHFF